MKENREIETTSDSSREDRGREVRCPNCDTGFTCRSGDILNCQCYAVPLSREIRDALAKTSSDCLCKNCLEKAALEMDRKKEKEPRQNKPALIENLHFYMEGGLYVFTEYYHRERGYCCKNGCRHCPYE